MQRLRLRVAARGCRCAARSRALAAGPRFAPIRRRVARRAVRDPNGTWARRMAGDKVEILPDTIRLTLGVNDVLLLRNLDDVPQVFGPGADDAGPELPAAVRASRRATVRLHRARQRADDVIVEPNPATPLGATRAGACAQLRATEQTIDNEQRLKQDVAAAVADRARGADRALVDRRSCATEQRRSFRRPGRS